MNFLQINARCLVNYERRFLLSNAISLCQPAVICICETWLNNKISDSELLLNDLLIFRSDRKSTKDKNPHGGTLIAIQSVLNCRRLVLENFVPTTERVNYVLKTIGVQPQIVGMKRLGKFCKERAKPRTLLVTVSTEHEARMILAKNFENRDKLVNENVYLTYALT